MWIVITAVSTTILATVEVIRLWPQITNVYNKFWGATTMNTYYAHEGKIVHTRRSARMDWKKWKRNRPYVRKLSNIFEWLF